MAITVYTGQDWKYGFKEQSAWGTEITTSMVPLQIEELTFTPGVNFRPIDRAKGQRYLLTTDVTADVKGVLNTATFTQPALEESLDWWLYGAIQGVVEAVSTPFQKTLTFPQTQPDFSASAGLFGTIGALSPLASSSLYVHDAIVSSLTIACSPGTNDGLLTVTPEFTGRSFTDEAASVSFMTAPSIEYWHFSDLATKTIGSAVIIGPDGFSFTITNGAVRVGGTSGKPETLALPKYAVEGTIQVLWDAITKAELGKTLAGTGSTLILEWGSSGVDGHLKFTITMKYSGHGDLGHVEEGSYVSLPFVATGVYGTTEPFEAIISNAEDRGW